MAPAGEHAEARAALQPVGAGARQAGPRLARPATREARARRESSTADVLASMRTRTSCSCVRSSPRRSSTPRAGSGCASSPDAIDAGLPNHVALAPRTRSGSLRSGRPSSPSRTSSRASSRGSEPTPSPSSSTSSARRGALGAARRGAWDVSEYILYGRFVTDALARTASSPPRRCAVTTTRVRRSLPTELDAFLEGLAPDQIAVNITAKAGMNPAEYAAVIERHWASHGA